MLEVSEGSTARKTLAEAARRSLRSLLGDQVQQLTDAELVDSYDPTRLTGCVDPARPL